MFSLSTVFGQVMSSLLTILITLEFSFFSINGVRNKEPEPVPDDFTPVVRFAVCSDVHLNGDRSAPEAVKYKALFEEAYKYADSQKYDKLDAVLVAGDMTGSGKPEEYEQFMSMSREGLREGTEFLVCLGNHEFISYRDEDPTQGYAVYKQYVSEEVDTHVVINGYHFIGVSYSDDAKTFKGKTQWMKAELDAAVKDTRKKPIFVFQHPQPFNTVYGSVNWGDLTVKSVLVNYPQVVDFSGHSHYASSDPRSVWQGTFTAVGTGAVTNLMGNLNYISGDKDAPGESGAFWIVEADRYGSVRLKLFDLANRRFFDNVDYYLSDITNHSTNEYTWANLKSLDTAPQFPAGAKIGSAVSDDGSVSITFPDAYGRNPAENYKVTVKQGLKTVADGTFISNYVRSVSDGMTVDVGKLEPGTYSVFVKPFSPYAKGGVTLKGEITV